jgi:hypothetical protein
VGSNPTLSADKDTRVPGVLFSCTPGMGDD